MPEGQALTRKPGQPALLRLREQSHAGRSPGAGGRDRGEVVPLVGRRHQQRPSGLGRQLADPAGERQPEAPARRERRIELGDAAALVVAERGRQLGQGEGIASRGLRERMGDPRQQIRGGMPEHLERMLMPQRAEPQLGQVLVAAVGVLLLVIADGKDEADCARRPACRVQQAFT